VSTPYKLQVIIKDRDREIIRYDLQRGGDALTFLVELYILREDSLLKFSEGTRASARLLSFPLFDRSVDEATRPFEKTVPAVPAEALLRALEACQREIAMIVFPLLQYLNSDGQRGKSGLEQYLRNPALLKEKPASVQNRLRTTNTYLEGASAQMEHLINIARYAQAMDHQLVIYWS
jgi:hypothetical protein